MNEYNSSQGSKSVSAILTAVTVLLFAILLILISYRPQILRGIKKTETLQQGGNIAATFDKYMASHDYVGISNYVDANDIRFEWGEKYFEYNNIRYSASSFVYTEEALLQFYLNNDNSVSKYISSNISGNIRSIYRYADGDYELHDYLVQIKDDLNVLLKAYLNFTDEEIASIPDMSDAELTFFIETRLGEILNEQ